MSKKDVREIALKFTVPLIAPIKNATYKGVWSGYDGAYQYINSERILMLKSYGAKCYQEGLEICMNAIVEATKERGNRDVLKQFIKENSRFVVQLAKNKPDCFCATLKAECMNFLEGKDKKDLVKALDTKKPSDFSESEMQIAV